MHPFSIIVAEEKKTHGIGLNNRLPWHIKRDLEFFKTTTTDEPNTVVIMGRNTWESLPSNHRPLSDRINIVVTSQPQRVSHDDVICCSSLSHVWETLDDRIVS